MIHSWFPLAENRRFHLQLGKRAFRGKVVGVMAMFRQNTHVKSLLSVIASEAIHVAHSARRRALTGSCDPLFSHLGVMKITDCTRQSE